MTLRKEIIQMLDTVNNLKESMSYYQYNVLNPDYHKKMMFNILSDEVIRLLNEAWGKLDNYIFKTIKQSTLDYFDDKYLINPNYSLCKDVDKFKEYILNMNDNEDYIFLEYVEDRRTKESNYNTWCVISVKEYEEYIRTK